MVVLTCSVSIANVPFSYENARAAMQRKDWETANYEWRHILELDPSNQEASIGLAESLFNTGFYQDAIGILESIPLQKRPIIAELALGRTYAVTQDYSNSKAAYLRALNVKPFQINAFTELRNIYPKLSPVEKKEAKAKLDAIASAAKRKSGNSLTAGKYAEAAAYYEIFSTHYHTVGLLNDYGLVLLLSGQYKKAHDQFSLLNKLGKLRFSEVNSNAAIASLSIGNYAEAKTEILSAIQAAPTNKRKAQLYNNLGYILEMTRKRQEAKFAYMHATELDPKLLTPQMNLAFVQQADREYDEAIATYQRILKREPNNAEIWNRLGFVYELQYKSKPALGAYQKAIAINPKYKESYINLSLLYKKMGKMKQANESLRQLAELGFAEMEIPKAKGSVNTVNSQKNPLKYVVLFPSDPKVIANIQ